MGGQSWNNAVTASRDFPIMMECVGSRHPAFGGGKVKSHVVMFAKYPIIAVTTDNPIPTRVDNRHKAHTAATADNRMRGQCHHEHLHNSPPETNISMDRAFVQRITMKKPITSQDVSKHRTEAGTT